MTSHIRTAALVVIAIALLAMAARPYVRQIVHSLHSEPRCTFNCPLGHGQTALPSVSGGVPSVN